MQSYADQTRKKHNNSESKRPGVEGQRSSFMDNRPESIQLRKLQNLLGKPSNKPDACVVTDSVIQKMNDDHKSKKTGVYKPPIGRKLTREEQKDALLIDSDLSFELYEWLQESDLSNIILTNEEQINDYITVLLNKKIKLRDGSEHPVRMNIHYYDTKTPELGSIWISYVKRKKSDLNAQTNPKASFLLKTWQYQNGKSKEKDEGKREKIESESDMPKPTNEQILKELVKLPENLNTVEQPFNLEYAERETKTRTDQITTLIIALYNYNKVRKNLALQLEINKQNEMIGKNSKAISLAFLSAEDENFKNRVISQAIKTYDSQIEDLKYLYEIREQYYDNISKPFW